MRPGLPATRDSRVLGSSGLTISRIGLGCEPLGGTDWGDVDHEAARNAVRAAWRAGINVFDTADVYGLGRSERALANALGEARTEAVVATKFGVAWEDGDLGRAATHIDVSAARARSALRDSLDRLRLHTIPLYYMHRLNPLDPEADLEETLKVLDAARREGRVRALGLSHSSLEALQRVHRTVSIDAVQVEYSLLARDAEGVIDYCSASGISVFVYGTLAQGLLTGKYQPGSLFPPHDRRSRLPNFAPPQLGRVQPLIREMTAMADARGVACASVALAWALGDSRVDCCVVGAKTPDQVEEIIDASRIALTSEECECLVGLAAAAGYGVF